MSKTMEGEYKYMSSKILKNCKKTILHLLKSINYSKMPFDFDSLSTDGIDTVKVWYHKNYPYSYDAVLSTATIAFNNGTQAVVKQSMLSLDCYILDVEILHEGLCYKISSSEIDEDKVYSYNRILKQAHDQRDFWGELEL